MSQPTSGAASDALGIMSFAIGDWRGKGKQGPNEYDSIMTCLKSPDGAGVEIIQFDDDRGRGKVFYAEHLRVVPSETVGELKVMRKGFAYADAGDKLFLTHEVARKEGDGVRISPEEGSKDFLLNNLKLVREGEDGLKVEGTASAGGEPWTFEYHFQRVTPEKR